MKRAILLLATAFVGTLTGCSSRSCRSTTLTVQWAFTDAAGVTHACSDSGVAYVQVFLNGQAQTDAAGNTNFDCVTYANGVVLPNYPGGTYTLQMDAFDANNTLLYQDQRSVAINGCGDSLYQIDLAAVQGPLDIQYLLPVSTCPPNSFVWFSLTGLSQGTSSFVVDALRTPTQFPCGVQNPIPIDAPFGQYRLDFVQVVQFANGTFTSQFENCTPQSVNHFASDQITATLTQATTGCQ